MKKVLSIFVAVLVSLMFVTAGFATPPGQDKDPAGYYEHSVTGQIKYFANGHPGEPSQWTYIGSNPPGGGGCSGLCKGIQIGDYIAGGTMDFSGAKSSCWGNDYAMTDGFGGGLAENYNTAQGSKFFSGQAGYANVDSYLCSTVWSKDYGLSSSSFAKATVYSEATAAGGAYSVFGCGTYSESTTAVWGTAYQYNQAKEVGYYGANAEGWNESQASFYNEGYMSQSSNKYLSASFSHVEGSSTTQGFTNVSVDPSGPFRSAFAETGNTSMGNAGVQGQGQVITSSQNSGVGASAMSYFSYGGGTTGTGYATSMSITNVGANSFSATAFGSSYSSTMGRPVQTPQTPR